MSNTIIQIRRSTLNSEPSILNIAEPAYSYVSNSLFIGTPDSNGYIKIGGYSEVVKLNAAFNSANAAFASANAASGGAAAEAFDKANSAYANAIFANTVAVAAFEAANNVVSGGPAFDSANAAFNRANIANSVPVGNTMSNGYFTIRSTKNKINFIPGTNITINVDDEPSLNTSNITIGTGVLSTNANHVAIYTNTTGLLGEAPGLLISGNNLFSSGNITCGLEITLSEIVYPGNGTLFLKQTDPSKINYSLSSNGNFLNINRANGDIVFRENNSPQMTLKSDTGRLGIGTSTPSAPLHVNGTGVQEIRIQSTDNQSTLTMLSGGASPFTQVTGVNGPLYLNTQSANSDMIFRVGSLAERMRILGTTGNVGIGSNNPIHKLDVNAGINANSYIIISGLNVAPAITSAYTFAANNAMLAANAAFAMANAANLIPVGNTMSNGYFSVRSTKRRLNFIPGANITINVDDDPTLNTSNITITSSGTGGDPTDAFNRANIANSVPVGNTMSNGYFSIRSTRNKINFIPGTNITINVDDDPTLNTSNVTIFASAGSDPAAAFAYEKANAANIIAVASFGYANGVNTNTFASMAIAIAAYGQANTDWTYAANNVMLAANSAYAKANLAYTFAANNAFGVGNAAFASGNTTWTYAANTVMSAANAAFSMANAANLMPVGNTMANGYYSVRSTKRQLNFIPGTNITINVDDDPTLNTANITITSSASGGDPTDAFNRANIANLQPVGNTMANGYFSVRSTKNKINFIPGTNISINVDDDPTLNTSNVTITASAGSDPVTPFAYDKANSANSIAEAGLIHANSAYVLANTTWTYTSNNVMLAANSAFAMANAANLMPVGNTMSNGYFSVRSTLRRLNFIPGGDWVSINVNSDTSLNTSNIIITANLAGAFTQANLAWDKANLAYTFAANDAFLVGNSAYAAANTTWTYAANNVMLAANSAYAAANSTYTYASNVVMSAANASYAAANTTWTYAANNVQLMANSAFAMANAANLMPVGNTMANSYWTVRSTKRRLNFIPGTNITINVDDDPTLNTANIIIAASISGGDPSDAFGRANIANSVPVGNTMSNGYFSVRSTKNKINFIPGTNITINVDDDPTLNTANITITSTATGTGGGAAVSAVPPGSPTANDLWWSSETGKLYVYYNDGSSSQWVDASPGEVIANGAAEIAVAAFTKANTINVRSAAPLNITVSTTEPTGNSVGDIWIDTN